MCCCGGVCVVVMACVCCGDGVCVMVMVYVLW